MKRRLDMAVGGHHIVLDVVAHGIGLQQNLARLGRSFAFVRSGLATAGRSHGVLIGGGGSGAISAQAKPTAAQIISAPFRHALIRS